MKWDDRLDRFSARLREGHGRSYAEAVERIEDKTGDDENPYWETSDGSMCGIPGDPKGYDDAGGMEGTDAMRRRAWETIVLADLIDAASRASSGPGSGR